MVGQYFLQTNENTTVCYRVRCDFFSRLFKDLNTPLIELHTFSAATIFSAHELATMIGLVVVRGDPFVSRSELVVVRQHGVSCPAPNILVIRVTSMTGYRNGRW